LKSGSKDEKNCQDCTVIGKNGSLAEFETILAGFLVLLKQIDL